VVSTDLGIREVFWTSNRNYGLLSQGKAAQRFGSIESPEFYRSLGDLSCGQGDGCPVLSQVVCEVVADLCSFFGLGIVVFGLHFFEEKLESRSKQHPF
jgi:hypothetical protein